MIIARLRSTFPAAALAAFIVLLPGAGRAAPSTACSGEDLVAKMQREEPDRYRKMLDHFATIANGEGIFWKLEKPGVAPSYLFGTAHVTDDRVLDRLNEVEPILGKARALLVEIADLSPDLAKQVAIVQRYGMLPEGETLDSRLSEEQQELLGDATAAHGMPWFSARRMKASFLMITMSIPPCAKIAMMRGEKVLDARLIAFAQKKDIPVIGLETVDEQLALIGKLDEEKMLAALLEAASAGGQLAEDMYETTIRMHQASKIAMLMSFLEEKKSDYPASKAAMATFEGPIVEARNRTMHERALPEMEKGGVFMAVGALHLPDEAGLVELFRGSGFTVTPVTNP
jgi:uncharacterized protein YbaP (TraB family)